MIQSLVFFCVMEDYDRYCLPDKEGAKKFFDEANMPRLGQYLSDAYSSVAVLCIGMGLSFVLSIVFICFIKCSAQGIVWITHILFIVLLGVIGCLFMDKALRTINDNEKVIFIIIAIICWVIDLIVFITMFCFFYESYRAFRLIEISSEFIFSNCCSITVPIVGSILMCGYFLYWIYCIPYLYSIGAEVDYDSSPFASVDWDKTLNNMWYYQLVGLIWIIGFVMGSIQL